jgi:hypothetical protein
LDQGVEEMIRVDQKEIIRRKDVLNRKSMWEIAKELYRGHVTIPKAIYDPRIPADTRSVSAPKRTIGAGRSQDSDREKRQVLANPDKRGSVITYITSCKDANFS